MIAHGQKFWLPSTEKKQSGNAADRNHPGRMQMPDPVYKVVDIVGTSEQSISKAIENAIAKASGTLRNLGWFEVGQIRGNIDGGKVNRYQVTLKVGFTLE